MVRKSIAALCIVLVVSVAVNADIVTLELDNVSSGGTPQGPSPWITAFIDDGGTAGSVTMTVADSGIVGSEYLNKFYFNIDPSLDASNLNYTVIASTADAPTISTGTDAQTSDGDDAYDVVLGFTNSSGTGDRFGVGDILILEITGTDLSANAFAFLSAAYGDLGPFYASAHIGSIGDNGASAWISDGDEQPAVPEPGTMLLALLGGGAAAGARRRRVKLRSQSQK